MKPPLEANMHSINDYLCEHPELTPVEFRIAYFMVHADYGRTKNGLVWEGAKSISERLGCSRRKVQYAWKKMEELGWLTDTGRTVGRATLWQVEYQSLWNEASDWKRRKFSKIPDEVRKHLKNTEGQLIEEECTSECTGARTNGQGMRTEVRGSRTKRPVNAHPGHTNPPKESSESNPPKKTTMRTSCDGAATKVSGETSAGDSKRGRKRANPSSDLASPRGNQVQEREAVPVIPVTAPREETPKDRAQRLEFIRRAQNAVRQGIQPPGKYQRALNSATTEDLAAVESIRQEHRARERELATRTSCSHYIGTPIE